MSALGRAARVAFLTAVFSAPSAFAERTLWLVRPLYPGQETLIERTLTLFPEDHRQIVDARVVPVGADFRIEVASA